MTDIYIVGEDKPGELLINPQEVEEAIKDCLFRPEEIEPGLIPNNAVVVEGIMHKYGLHPDRLEAHREQVKGWLAALPQEFRKEVGGGWSFLNACNQANGVQWTGLHSTMEALFVLGIGLGYANFMLSRRSWSVMPGGMPYIEIDLSGEEA